jgi:hypothetical protein
MSYERLRKTDPLAPVLHMASRSHGKPLDAGLRAEFEPSMNHTFRRVRVHTDADAARSAAALNAGAFTVGEDIYFGAGRFAPGTREGRKLLAHELTHVVQQDGGSASIQTCRIVEPQHGAAEREARSVATAIDNGSLPAPITAHASGTVQRSVLGDIGGALLGIGAGALLGFAVGGPIGAIIGGVLGGVGGLAAGDALTADKRGLTGTERSEAHMVFGDSLNYSAVKIAEAPIMAIGENARTPFDTIYFPPGTSKLSFDDFMPWLIHELTHSWQYQHGVSVFTKLFWALHGAKAYQYGSEKALVQAAAEGKNFTDFNTEQQGDILRDYYIALKSGKDTSPFDPFIAEVQAGGKVGKRSDLNQRSAPRKSSVA